MTASIPEYLLIGHITADLVSEGRQLGGTVSYAAKTAHAFGLHVAILTSAAEGEPLLGELQDDAEIVALPAAQTTTFENIYVAGARVQYIRGVAAPLAASHIPAHWRSSPLVHIAPLANEIDPQIVHSFPGSIIMLTLQGWLRDWDESGRVHFKRWYDVDILKAIGIVVFSEEDIAGAPDLEAEIASVAPTLVITRADKGGTYYRYGQPFTYSTPQVKVVHPTGAGDVFAGSLLASLHKLDAPFNSALPLAVRVAASLAASSVTRSGLESAPSPDEVRQVLAEVSYG